MMAAFRILITPKGDGYSEVEVHGLDGRIGGPWGYQDDDGPLDLTVEMPPSHFPFPAQRELLPIASATEPDRVNQYALGFAVEMVGPSTARAAEAAGQALAIAKEFARFIRGGSAETVETAEETEDAGHVHPWTPE
jgi:hypothetical protein